LPGRSRPHPANTFMTRRSDRSLPRPARAGAPDGRSRSTPCPDTAAPPSCGNAPGSGRRGRTSSKRAQQAITAGSPGDAAAVDRARCRSSSIGAVGVSQNRANIRLGPAVPPAAKRASRRATRAQCPLIVQLGARDQRGRRLPLAEAKQGRVPAEARRTGRSSSGKTPGRTRERPSRCSASSALHSLSVGAWSSESAGPSLVLVRMWSPRLIDDQAANQSRGHETRLAARTAAVLLPAASSGRLPAWRPGLALSRAGPRRAPCTTHNTHSFDQAQPSRNTCGSLGSRRDALPF
jgi:hypothetical protein